MADDLSEEAEERWCAGQRETVIAYLVQQGFSSPSVGEWPAWHVAPIIAVWAIESRSRPDWVGWWAISGDLPTDYTTCRDDRHPRQALRDIGARWIEAGAAWARGQRHERISLGSPQRQEELAPLLEARGKTLIQWAADDDIWSG
jgi:hypothetical protein